MARTNTPVADNTQGTNSEIPVTPAAGQASAPIVQPSAFAPYTSSQVVWQNNFSSGYGYAKARRDIDKAYESEVTEELPPIIEAPLPEKKRVHFIPILLAIFSLLIIAVIVVGKYALQDYLTVLEGKSGLDFLIKDLVDNFKGTITVEKLIIPGALAIVALFSVLNFIGSLCAILKKGATVFSKVCIFFMLTFSLVALLLGLVKNMEIGYGLYALVGISFLSLLFGYLAKN